MQAGRIESKIGEIPTIGVPCVDAAITAEVLLAVAYAKVFSKDGPQIIEEVDYRIKGLVAVTRALCPTGGSIRDILSKCPVLHGEKCQALNDRGLHRR